MSLKLYEAPDGTNKIGKGQLAFDNSKLEAKKKQKQKDSKLAEIPMSFRVLEMKEIRQNISWKELIAPYDTVDIIGFSYSLGFIEKCVLPYVQYCRLLLGADFLRVKKGGELASQFLRVEKNNAKAVQSHPKVVEAFKNGSLEIKTAVSIVDHRKYYLFRGETAAPLIIDTSANPTTSGWDESHIESRNIIIGDDAYSVYSHEFDAAWKLSNNLPLEAIEVDVKNDDLENCPSVAHVLHTGEAVLLEEPKEPRELVREEVVYTADLQNSEKNVVEKELAKVKYDPSNEEGMTLIDKSIIHKVKKELSKKSSRPITVKLEKKVAKYPALDFDYDNGILYQDKKEVPFPSREEIIKSAKVILKIYENFDDFTGTKEEILQTKFMWYKVMNYMFASPFFAEVRTKEFEIGKTRDALPMYAVIYSPKSSAGKSFMTNAIVQMMLGIRGSQADWGKALKETNKRTGIPYYQLLEKLQTTITRSPIVIDEAEVIISGSSKKSVSDHVFKQTTECEKNYRTAQPCILFNINGADALNDDVGRKRVAHFYFTTSLSSKIDVCSYGNQSEQLLQQLDNKFYQRYCEIMIKEIGNELENLPSQNVDQYIDILKISSQTIIQIFQEIGLELPEFIKPLSWRKDYCKDAKYHSENALKEIAYILKNNPNDVIIKDKYIILYIQDKEYRGQNKQIQKWKDVLPDDLRMEELPSSDRPDYAKIRILRSELEYELGYSLQAPKHHFWNRKKKEK